MPPLIGKSAPQSGGQDWRRPAREIPDSASSRPPCLAANMRPMAAVSTAPSRKQAKASGSSSFRSVPVNGGQPDGRQSLRHCAKQLHARALPSESADAATMPPMTTNSATGLFFRKIFPKMSTASAAPPIEERCGIGFVQMLKEIAAVLPKICHARRGSQRAWAIACWREKARRRI